MNFLFEKNVLVIFGWIYTNRLHFVSGWWFEIKSIASLLHSRTNERQIWENTGIYAWFWKQTCIGDMWKYTNYDRLCTMSDEPTALIIIACARKSTGRTHCADMVIIEYRSCAPLQPSFTFGMTDCKCVQPLQPPWVTPKHNTPKNMKSRYHLSVTVDKIWNGSTSSQSETEIQASFQLWANRNAAFATSWWVASCYEKTRKWNCVESNLFNDITKIYWRLKNMRIKEWAGQIESI